jgi:hypothetical protein
MEDIICVDGGIISYNPCHITLNEACAIWPGKLLEIFVSLGNFRNIDVLGFAWGTVHLKVANETEWHAVVNDHLSSSQNKYFFTTTYRND